ncbi:MAG: hypothetical protein R3C05_04370 [Pirellulaceae bacterium]
MPDVWSQALYSEGRAVSPFSVSPMYGTQPAVLQQQALDVLIEELKVAQTAPEVEYCQVPFPVVEMMAMP